MKFKNKKIAATAAILALSITATIAGPVVIDGTDANDHGSASGGVNFTGWLYMQKALSNLAPQVGNGNKVIVDLGTTSGTQAGDAISSAFTGSGLSGSGWSILHVDGAANISSFLTGGTVGGASLANTGLIYLPTYNNASGDLAADEMAVINANAAVIASFVGGAGIPALGGGLFAMGESNSGTNTGAYGWLNTLVGGIAVTDQTTGGVNNPLSLTAGGIADFPGLTNADLSAGPWHANFSGNLGSLQVLATSPDAAGVSRNVIIGGGAGTVITNSVPDSGATFAMLGIAMSGIAGLRRKLGV